MVRKEIGIPLDRENRNNHNDNYKELFGVVNNIVGTITDEVYEKIIDGSKLNWKDPVESQDDLPSDGVEGDTRMTRNNGKVYRYDGTRWKEIQQIDAGPVNEVDRRLSSQLAETAQQIRDISINVKDFGAKGNGTTDDTESIKNAIESIDGGTILFPPGIYIVKPTYNKQSILLKSNIKVIGSGVGSTVLKLADDAPRVSAMVIGVKGTEKNITISDLEIDGNKQRKNGDFETEGEGIDFGDGTENVWISNVYVHDCMGEGIDIDESYNVFISNVVIEDCAGNGLHISDGTPPENVNVSNVVIKNCGHGRDGNSIRAAGLVLRCGLTNINNINIINCVRGIHVDGQNIVDLKHININNCNVINPSKQAILIRELSPILIISDSYLEGNKDYNVVSTLTTIEFDKVEFKKENVSPANIYIRSYQGDSADKSKINNSKIIGGSQGISVEANGVSIAECLFENVGNNIITMNKSNNNYIVGNIGEENNMSITGVSNTIFSNNIFHGVFTNADKGNINDNIIIGNVFNSVGDGYSFSGNVFENNIIKNA